MRCQLGPLMVFSLVIVVMVLSGCSGNVDKNYSSQVNNTKNCTILLEKFLANSNVDYVEGNNPSLYTIEPIIRYSCVFDNLPVYFDAIPEINHSLKVLYAVDRLNISVVDMPQYLTLTGIYDFPAQTAIGPIIESVDENGTVNMSFNNAPIILKVGETWTSPSHNFFLLTNNESEYWYDDVSNGSSDIITFNNFTLVSDGVEDRSCRIFFSAGDSKNRTTNTWQLKEPISIPANAVIKGYSYVMQVDISYQLVNIGTYNKTLLMRNG